MASITSRAQRTHTLADLLAQSPDRSDMLASPRMANACVEAMLTVWLAAEATGTLDLRQPLQILDLAPGHGRLAAQVLPRLHRRLNDIGRAHWQFQYIAQAEATMHAAQLLAHPQLAPWQQHGGFSAQADAIGLVQAGNPLAVLAAGAFGRREPAWWGIHHANRLRGQLQVMPGDQDGQYLLRCDWTSCNTALPRLAGVAELLDFYRHALYSAAFPLPEHALGQLADLIAATEGRYLLVALDHGVADLNEIRVGALNPPSHWQVGVSGLGVNFHALSYWQSQLGAAVHTLPRQGSSPLLQLAWRDNASPEQISVAAVLEYAAAAQPAEQIALIEAAQSMPPSLALLRASVHDPFVLAPMLPALLENTPADQLAWQQALAATWQNNLALPLEASFSLDLANLAARLGQYGLARAVLRHIDGLAGVTKPLQAAALCGLAEVECHTGRSHLALPLLQRAMVLTPDCTTTHARHAALAARLGIRQQRGWAPPADEGDDMLVLEPLDDAHASAFFHQYRDPQIAALTLLDEFAHIDEVVAWISGPATQSGQQHFAIMHRDAAFVGVLGLTCQNGAGYFHFWIGTDFQGRGLGPRAARLLLDSPQVQCLDVLYTSVLAGNLRSRRVLEQLGWLPLPSKALPPDDDMLFFHYPLATVIDTTQLHVRLLALCAQTDSAFRFAPQGVGT
ncbi:hypothetical protein IGB42_00383 [Andreprevotia sp. IGB-42]|uniref:GNAT family N-acetyltransferase n=1 Tax=Andreprevotia sp. IGB-42 TaxID=2497473 RepID=UPI00135A292C|nr:GNAT family N-acetyltransferase [Andreprevotia sp. IGB-42]KAF0815302.1 hypothetical protein IGB42_00383 [Andreprevotia sp. IGB-42]